MKDLLIAMGLAVFLSCTINSVMMWLTNSPEEQSPFPVGCSGIRAGIMGTKKDDFRVPPMNAVDQSESSGYATDVLDGSPPSNVRYPVNGVW